MVPEDGSAFVNPTCIRRLVPLLLAFGLAACGVKGALEPPPDSGIESSAKARNIAAGGVPKPPVPRNRALLTSPEDRTAAGTTSSAVREAPAAERSSILDWLID